MSSSKSRRQQTPAQRAAQRRAAAAPPAPATAPSAESDLVVVGRERTPFDDEVFVLSAVAHESAGVPFRMQLEGDDRVFEFRSPEAIDWQEASSIADRMTSTEDYRPLLRMLLDDQYEDFLDLPMSMAQLNLVLGKWRAWHGISLPESGASRRS